MSAISQSPFANSLLLLFKSDLLEQKSKCTYAMDRAQTEIRSLVDFGPGDAIDESCGNASKEAIFSTYSQNRTQLRKVEHAPERITDGEYGICSLCEEAIGLKRLQAAPWVTTCIQFQEQSERARKTGL